MPLHVSEKLISFRWEYDVVWVSVHVMRPALLFPWAPDPSVPETNLQLHLIPGTFLLLCLFFFFPRKVFPQITS